jgi:hypothetical protein
MKFGKLNTVELCAFTAALLAAMMVAPAPSFAAQIAPLDTYTYTFDLPIIDLNGNEVNTAQTSNTTFTVTFADGAFGTPTSFISGGETATGSAFLGGYLLSFYTATGSSLPNGNNDLPEMLIEYYADPANEVLSFAFLEPQAFWNTPGNNLSFGNDDSDDAYGLLFQDFVIPANQTFGDTNIGASWTITQGADDVDPPCDTCSVTIAATPTAGLTPEPNSLLLLGSGLVGLAGVARRKLGLHP